MLDFKSAPKHKSGRMNIYGKFSWKLFSGFREEELNVKS
jgi:hypothetical protein